MHFVQNFPFFCILLTLICAVVTSVLKGRPARWLTMGLIMAVTAALAAASRRASSPRLPPRSFPP